MGSVPPTDRSHGDGESEVGVHADQRALANLRHTVRRGTAANVLKANGIEPAPERGKHTRWVDVSEGALEGLCRQQFFSIEVWTGRGPVIPPIAAGDWLSGHPATADVAESECIRRALRRSIKDECLSRMIFVGQASLRRAIAHYVAHYHTECNHQGLENQLIRPEPGRAGNDRLVHRRPRLGGMLNCYYSAAA